MSDIVKTISLRTLVREPRKVKRLTRAGRPVQVTDHGHPLWIIQPVAGRDDSEQRRHEMEAELAGVLQEPRSATSLAKLILESRR